MQLNGVWYYRLGKMKIDVEAMKFAIIQEEKSVIDIFDFQNNSLQVICKFDTA